MTFFIRIGLGDFGKKQDYFVRQIRTWTKNYMASKTSNIEEMEKLIKWLPHNIPEDQRYT